jgi:hypothetical protein
MSVREIAQALARALESCDISEGLCTSYTEDRVQCLDRRVQVLEAALLNLLDMLAQEEAK